MVFSLVLSLCSLFPFGQKPGEREQAKTQTIVKRGQVGSFAFGNKIAKGLYHSAK